MCTVRCSGHLGGVSAQWEGVCLRDCTSPPRGQTDTCKNIAFRQLLRTVNMSEKGALYNFDRLMTSSVSRSMYLGVNEFNVLISVLCLQGEVM